MTYREYSCWVGGCWHSWSCEIRGEVREEIRGGEQGREVGKQGWDIEEQWGWGRGGLGERGVGGERWEQEVGKSGMSEELWFRGVDVKKEG